ncbi:MAG: cell division protein ZipA C-terminal FtsZ-binding domain-containing protein, partial [Burkholderiales bacterium]
PTPAIKALEAAFVAVGRRVKLSGYDYHARTWEPVTDPHHWYTSLRLSLQLVDRDGPVTQEQLNTLASLTREHARRIGAIAELPEIAVASQKAAELDEFCSDVDVIVGINVIAQTGQLFNGTQIRALAEANGMQLQASGVFVCHDEEGKLLFTLDNQDSRPFRAEHLRQLTTPGITFLLDVPRTLDGLKVFDQLVATSTQFAKSLDGMLADDNRVALNDVGLDKIRNQLRAIYSKMEHRGILAGSAAAQRLFS